MYQRNAGNGLPYKHLRWSFPFKYTQLWPVQSIWTTISHVIKNLIKFTLFTEKKIKMLRLFLFQTQMWIDMVQIVRGINSKHFLHFCVWTGNPNMLNFNYLQRQCIWNHILWGMVGLSLLLLIVRKDKEEYRRKRSPLLQSWWLSIATPVIPIALSAFYHHTWKDISKIYMITYCKLLVIYKYINI